MNEILIHKAKYTDIQKLVQLRIDFLKMDRGYLSEDEEKIIRNQSEKYFSKHLNDGDFVAIIAKDGEQIVSTAFLIIQERPASPSFITGFTGTLLNVMTYPEYRNRKIASTVIEAIINEARNKKVSSIDLASTSDGLKLYRKFGFSELSYTAMRLKL